MPTSRRALALAVLALASGAAAGPCVTCPSPAGTFDLGWWHDRPLTMDGEPHAPRIDADEWDGRVLLAVAFEERSGGDGDISLARSDDGGCSFAIGNLTSGPQDDRQPDLAASARFDQVVIAFLRDGVVHALASGDGGLSFSAPEPVDPLATADPGSSPRVASVPVGERLHVHLVWIENGRLHHALSRDGGTAGSWESEPPISERFAGFGPFSSADVSADTRSASPGVESGVSIVVTAPGPARSVGETWVVRSNDSGGSFFGDPTDPATRDRPRRVSDPRADDPLVSTRLPVLDSSDDGSGVFLVWNVAAWTDPGAGGDESRADARGEEGVTPSVVADWNDPPASGDAGCGVRPSRAAALALVPNPLDRPPTPDVHLFHEEGAPGSTEIGSCRGLLDRRALPTLALDCGPYPLTGLYPTPRAAGEVEPGSLAADEDLSHVYLVWSDDRDGRRRLYFKRTDTVTAPPTAIETGPGACAGGGGILVRWRPPAAPPHCDLERVTIEYGLSPGDYQGAVEARGAAEATIAGLEYGTRYYLRVSAVDEACNRASAPEVSALAADCTSFPPCPNPVGNTLLARRAGEDVVLFWLPPPVDTTHGPASSHDVYRSTALASSGYDRLAGVPELAYLDRSAVSPSSPGDRHFYRVVAGNACGTSGDVPPP